MRKETLIIAMCMIIAFGMALMGQSVAEQLPPVMKEIALRMESLKKGIDSKSAVDAANDAERLQSLFIRASGIFRANGAAKVADSARANVGLGSEITRAVNGENFDAAAKAAGALQKSCKTCHDRHREQLPDRPTFKPW